MQADTARLITSLFKIIGTEESLIEIKRQDISMSIDFDPLKYFQLIDSDNDGFIDSKDLINFMKDRFYKISEHDANLIIREYDADFDGVLTYQEYQQLVLPSTNPSLRQISIMRSESPYPYRKERPIKEELCNKLCLQLENELRLVKRREEIKKALLKQEDFIKQKAFSEISQQQENITVQNLVEFLYKHCFVPKREDLEAILRRLDHSDDRMLSLEEFCEATSVNENNLNPEEAEDERIMNSTEKKQLKKEVQNSPSYKRSNSKEDLIEEPIEESLRKYESPEKTEATQKRDKGLISRKLDLDQEEVKDQEKEQPISDEEIQQLQNEEKPLQYRFLYLLKSQIKLDKEVELQKESLFSYENFNTIDAFKIFDSDNKGYITLDDLNKVITEKNLTVEIGDEEDQRILKFINRFDKDKDGKLNYSEFSKAITPQNSKYLNFNKPRHYYGQKESEFDSKLRQREWLEEIGKVIDTSVSSDYILENIRNEMNLDSEELFKMIDQFNFGYLSTNILARFVSEKCGYKLIEDELKMILSRYDKNNDYRIRFEEFQSEVEGQQFEKSNEDQEANQEENYQQQESFEIE